MIVLDPATLAGEARATHPSRPATAIALDSADARLIVFRLLPGQEVAPHRSDSTVMLTVLAGRGVVSGSDGARDVGPGDLVIYDPQELHGMRATEEELRLLAVIAPRPGIAKPTRAAGGAA